MSLVIIYRWVVEEARHDAFRERWRQGTERFRKLGGLGSCLTQNESGEFVAIALWTDEETRERFRALSPPPSPMPGILSFSEEKLWVDDDMWASSPFQVK